ncbi:MAG: response regulator [Cytophagaceae bacterium]|nr:response regulator [Cytophagaceae bacterium]
MKKLVSVVVADDDADDFFLLKTSLEEQQVRNPLHYVESGRQLLEFLSETSNGNQPSQPLPGLIFLDINMPGMNGLETLGKLKNHAVFKSIPIVMFSTVSNPETVQAAYRLGANSFIAKPTTMQGMAEIIHCVHKCFLELPAVAA